MRRPIFNASDLDAIRTAQASSPCAKCQQTIAPGTLFARDVKGEPVHIGPCPEPGVFTAARIEFARRGP